MDEEKGVSELPSGDSVHHTRGPDYEAEQDKFRLDQQLQRIRQWMLPRGWHTLAEISEACEDPPASVSAQLRHLRKTKFGAYTVVKRRRGSAERGLWEYRVEPPSVLDELDRSREELRCGHCGYIVRLGRVR